MKSSLYAKYYFELRALFKDNEKEFPLKPINKQEADRLEVRSKEYIDIFEGEGEKAKTKRLTSTIGSIQPKSIWDWKYASNNH